MPRIELISVPLYSPNDPYFWEVDNLPLVNLMRRQNLINMALDNVIAQVRDAQGNQGTFNNRLNQSIGQDGSLKKSAVDEALHSIESHTDSDSYVKMKKEESDKLYWMAEQATSLYLTVVTDNAEVNYSDGQLRLVPSSTITFSVNGEGQDQQMQFDMVFPAEAAHQHLYNQPAIPADLVNPDYQNYKANSESIPYMEGTLRVYVNGVRINPYDPNNPDYGAVYVPGFLVTDPWTLMQFTPSDDGTFQLSSPVSADDVVVVDYDMSLID